MSPTAQKVAIAESRGFVRQYIGSTAIWVHPGLPRLVYHLEDLPDYLNDLNLMHLCEKGFVSDGQWEYYKKLLYFAAKDDCGEWGQIRGSTHATAAQKAEAYLKTMWLWREGAVKVSDVPVFIRPLPSKQERPDNHARKENKEK